MAAGMSRNFNVYTPEELAVFAEKLVNAPVYIEHVAVENAAGKVTKCNYDPASRCLLYEAEIHDQAIVDCSHRIATFLQLIKETCARPGGIWRIDENSFDYESHAVSIVPEKGSNPRIFPMSQKLEGMLSRLERRYDEYYFSLPHMKLDHFRVNYEQQRKTIAQKLNSPRLKRIMFKTLRTWGRNDGLSPHQRHSLRHETARTQEHQKHAKIHTVRRGAFQRRNRLRFQSCKD
jgi:hypothetical protein